MVPFLYSKRGRQLQSEEQDFASVVALVGRIAGEQDVQENAERIHIAGCRILQVLQIDGVAKQNRNDFRSDVPGSADDFVGRLLFHVLHVTAAEISEFHERVVFFAFENHIFGLHIEMENLLFVQSF